MNTLKPNIDVRINNMCNNTRMNVLPTKFCLCLIVLLVSHQIKAQLAIINDSDGYTNLRKKAESKSEIIYKILENEVFFVTPDEDRKDAEWVLISFPINKFSLGCSSDNDLSGYIHHSRIKFLKDLSENKSSDFSFKYNLKPFDKGEHIIQYNEGKFVTFVDGRHPWGTDGGLPKTEVKTIQVSYKGKSYRVSESLYGDIYECSNRFKVYTKNEVYFIYQMNSDGAGAYEIVWVLQRRV